MKIAYIGIDLFFEALCSLERCGCEIVEVFSCVTDNKTEFNVKIREFAEKRNIPCQMTRITKADIERLKEKGCKMAVCGGYYFKIPWDTDFTIVNIHPTLLPVGRGPWPMPQVILKGMKKSGVTVHKIAESFDSGDILLQREFEVLPDETLETYMKKAEELLPEMMETLVQSFDALWENAKPQEDSPYWSAPLPEDFTVSCDMSAWNADKILRAFFGYECIYQGENETFEIIGGRAEMGESPDDECLPLKDGYIKTETKKRIL